MRKRIVPGRTTLWILGLPLAVATLVAGPSCSSSTPPPPTMLSTGCSINSDCTGKLICAFGSCHEQCKTSKDCNGATCLPPSDVCELPQETMCSGMLPCVTGLTCADNICRAPCSPGVANGSTGGCLGTQSCVEISKEHVCVDSASDGGTSSKDAGGHDSSSDGHEGTSDAHGGTSDAHGGTSDANGGTSDAESDGSKREGGSGTDGSFMSNPTAGSLGFTVSNVDLEAVDAGALMGEPSSGRAPSDPASGLWANAPDVTPTGSTTFSTPTITVTLMDGTSADLYVWNSFTLPDTASITFGDTNPVILAVLTTVSIQGTIYVNDGNAGGFSDATPGPGAGQGGNGFAANSGGGGGSFCGMGGSSGSSTSPGSIPTGGPTYGNANLIPLVAGSNGGNDGFNGGRSGGAIEIVAGTSITVGAYGHIQAGGQGGYTAGGGSGGAILLEAPTVVVQGTLAANGGGGGSGNNDDIASDGIASAQPAAGEVDNLAGGTAVGGVGSAGATINGGNGGPNDPGTGSGGGGGGAGRIRINTATGVATLMTGSVISPAMGTMCMTQGMLTP
jgi:hypothetical protein